MKPKLSVVGEQTVLTKAASKSDSLRTTVPMSIVRYLKLKEGDRLTWELEAKDNKLIVIVSCSATTNK
jgi:bifunctional DNA-binding transcriptional regulator/antitoxin component of YhaV-PrlF toxin-antitoxin module